MQIGVDIGGSGARASAVVGGVPVDVQRVSWSERTPEAVVAALLALLRPLRPTCVGVGFPGFIRDGIVVGAPNLEGWASYPLAATLRERLGCAVVVENDANMAAFGAAQRFGDLLLLTLGTGVGGGAVFGGRLFKGARQTGLEVGHVFVGGEGRCGCGAIGCLETEVGARSWVAQSRALGLDIRDAEQLMALAESGHETSQRFIDRSGILLGRALAGLVNVLAPPQVVVGGGLAQPGSRLEDATQRAFERQVIPENLVSIQFIGDAAELSIIGSVSWAAVTHG